MVLVQEPPAIHAPAADLPAARRVLARARHAGRVRLLEPEGRELLRAIGVSVPRATFVERGRPVVEADLEPLAGDRVVVKVVAQEVAHKTEVGGVAVVARSVAAVSACMAAMTGSLAPIAPAGFLVAELVEHEHDLGGELLVGARWSRDFGSIVTIGAGGLHAEALAADLRPDAGLGVVAAGLAGDRIGAAIAGVTAVRLATTPQRGQPPRLAPGQLNDVLEHLSAMALALMPHELLELEINPLAVAGGELVALDVLVILGDGRPTADDPPRPTWKLGRLLEPRSIAIAGVSSGENPGRTILRNVLRDGFPPDAVTVIKPGIDTIDGCACVAAVEDLERPVDLFVAALSARASAAMVAELVERSLAEAVIVIPGGLEEKAGGGAHAARIHAALGAARATANGGPLINGGNCLGIRSRPGRYDTLFIPESRLAAPSGRPVPLAIVAQSGAFAISRLDRLEGLNPKYVVTVGNQMDLTIGDYVDHFARDPEIEVVGVYVEGFRPLDGRRFLEAVARITRRGSRVVLYQAGRTRAGAAASASHTAVIAGDAVVTTALARQAGAIVADTVEAFDALIGTLARLSGRTLGPRLGAVSNAGFECVAIGDHLDGLVVAELDPPTAARLGAVLRDAGAGDVVDVHNPLDLTPMAGDAAFAAACEAMLASEAVDVGVVGLVPFATTLRTVPGKADEPTDLGLAAPHSVAARLIELWRSTSKAWVAVVDAGTRYDPLAASLAAAGIPTFRHADTAVRTLATLVEASATSGPPE